MRRYLFEVGVMLSMLLAMMLVVLAADGYPLSGWIVRYLAGLGTTSVVLMTVGAEERNRDE